MPPRSLTGTLFGTAAALWWLLLGVLIVLLTPNGNAPSLGFWLGTILVVASGFACGAALNSFLVRRLPTQRPAAGLVHFALAGILVLLLSGAAALLLGLLIVALAAGPAPVWGALRGASPATLALPVGGAVLLGAPFGIAAGMVLRALLGPEGAPSANGSRRRPPR